MKIVQVINSMINQKNKISDVQKSGGEYFFLFNNKYKWSLIKNSSDYSLFYYPHENMTIRDLANSHVDEDDYVVYSTTEIRTREAQESFSELYQLLVEKVFNLDNIFDDIIESDDGLPF